MNQAANSATAYRTTPKGVPAEVFLPGDYCDRTRNDVAVSGRYELVFTW